MDIISRPCTCRLRITGLLDLLGDDLRWLPAVTCSVSVSPEEYRTVGFGWEMTSCTRRIYSTLDTVSFLGQSRTLYFPRDGGLPICTRRSHLGFGHYFFGRYVARLMSRCRLRSTRFVHSGRWLLEKACSMVDSGYIAGCGLWILRSSHVVFTKGHSLFFWALYIRQGRVICQTAGPTTRCMHCYVRWKDTCPMHRVRTTTTTTTTGSTRLRFFSHQSWSKPTGRHVGAWRTRWCRSQAARAQDAVILAPRTDGGPDGPGYGDPPLLLHGGHREWRSTEPEESHQDRERGRSARRTTRPSSGRLFTKKLQPPSASRRLWLRGDA